MILLGNKKLMDESNVSLLDLEKSSDKLAEEGKTPMFIAIEGKFKWHNCCSRHSKRK